jgi:two-component sensor histidine kinase
MSGGVALIDYDGDGWLDIYFTNAQSVEMALHGVKARSALFHNNHDGTFTDVTDKAGVGYPCWAMGAVVGDYNNDGWPDLLVTCMGGVVLYRNNGDGTFTDVTKASGLASDSGWATGAAFGDYDGDGWADLFVSHYVDFHLDDLPAFGSGKSCKYLGLDVQCGPRGLKGSPDNLYHNNGDGTFTDVSKKSGVEDPEHRTARLSKLQEDQGRMIGDITHGLQTPLTILKTQIETARKRPQAPVKWDLCEALTDRMSRLLYDLLKLIRLETGKEDFRSSRVDLSALLRDMGENLDVLMRQKRIVFKTDIAPGVTVRGRKDAIEDLVTNLLSNAVKYIAASELRMITLGLHGTMLSVSDTGIGIPKEDLPHIFKRFYRARNHIAEGTGLGLAICQTIAEKHQATITVESEEGKGATFKIIFPSLRRQAALKRLGSVNRP